MTKAGQKNHGSYYELYRMAGATEISIDAAIKAVLSGLDGILLLVDLKKKTPLRPFVVNNAFSPYS